MPLLIHLSETKRENDILAKQYQKTPTASLDSISLFGPEVLAAHAVWMTDDDLGILKQRGVVGVAQSREQHEALERHRAGLEVSRAGVPVGLGTDGAASNNDFDMFEEMRMTAFLHKLQTNDPQALPAPLALNWPRVRARARSASTRRSARWKWGSAPTCSSSR